MHEPAVQVLGFGRRPRPELTLKRVSVRLDVLLLSGAIAILALHATVDSFLAPEPGTGPGDHLVRGFVSLAVLALAAAICTRLPAGGRAAP